MDVAQSDTAANGDDKAEKRDHVTWSKPTSVGPGRRSYSGGVSDYELDSMSLTSSVCRAVNGRMRKNSRKHNENSGHVDFRNNMRANDAFFVKTGHERFYGSSLTFPHNMTLVPTSVCPDVDVHEELITEHALPLACPTCWSAQRNGMFTKVKVKADKKRCSKSPVCNSKCPPVCK